MSDVVIDGVRLIAQFLASKEYLDNSRQRVNAAECDLSNAERALARWLMPSDMKPGEKIAVWHGDSLFQVELAPHTAYPAGEGEPSVSHEPKVTVRTRRKHFSDLRRIA